MRFSSLILAAIIATTSYSISQAQSSVTMAPGQPHVIEQYRAFIGRDDLFNSRGMRLTQPWEILRQDRANFHRFGIRQQNEGSDSYFATTENRKKMESMVRSGFTLQEAGDAIVNGLVWVNVQIIGYGTTGKSVRVSVER